MAYGCNRRQSRIQRLIISCSMPKILSHLPAGRRILAPAMVLLSVLIVASCDRPSPAYVLSANADQMVSMDIVEDTGEPKIRVYIDFADFRLSNGGNIRSIISDETVYCSKRSYIYTKTSSVSVDGKISEAPTDGQAKLFEDDTIGSKIYRVSCEPKSREKFVTHRDRPAFTSDYRKRVNQPKA
jgi:hypothetical protein